VAVKCRSLRIVAITGGRPESSAESVSGKPQQSYRFPGRVWARFPEDCHRERRAAVPHGRASKRPGVPPPGRPHRAFERRRKRAFCDVARQYRPRPQDAAAAVAARRGRNVARRSITMFCAIDGRQSEFAAKLAVGRTAQCVTFALDTQRRSRDTTLKIPWVAGSIRPRSNTLAGAVVGRIVEQRINGFGQADSVRVAQIDVAIGSYCRLRSSTDRRLPAPRSRPTEQARRRLGGKRQQQRGRLQRCCAAARSSHGRMRQRDQPAAQKDGGAGVLRGTACRLRASWRDRSRRVRSNRLSGSVAPRVRRSRFREHLRRRLCGSAFIAAMQTVATAGAPSYRTASPAAPRPGRRRTAATDCDAGARPRRPARGGRATVRGARASPNARCSGAARRPLRAAIRPDTGPWNGSDSSV